MKSLSNLYSRTSEEQLKPWDIAELDIKQEASIDGIDKDQMLALFRQADENTVTEEGHKPRSALYRAGTGLALTSWQPGEIDLQTPLEVEDEWFVVEMPSDSYESVETEAWKQESLEKESEVSLQQARAQAEEILLKARMEADQILLKAEEEIEQEKKNGYQEGWDTVRSEMRQSLKAAGSILDEMQKWQADFMSQGEQTIVEMLKEMAQTMFGEGAQLDANALQINLNRIMENAQRLGDLNIFLNPRDANLLDPSWKEYQFLISGNKVRVIQSEKITPGGCIIKGNTGMVDGRVETQLATVLKTIDELREVAQ